MRSINRKILIIVVSLFLVFAFLQGIGAQSAVGSSSSSGEMTVEEKYLQEYYENLVISEQSKADGKDNKAVALKYIKDAIDNGRRGVEIEKSLEYLAFEGNTIITRSGGYGSAINNFPDIRAKACEYLGEFHTVEAKDALVKVALSDQEPMVLAAAVRSLGNIGINDGDEVTQIISYLVSKFDILAPDNSLAFESLVALERIADKNGGIKDASAIRAVIRISSGNYIKPVKDKANEVLNKIRKYSSAASSTAQGSGK